MSTTVEARGLSLGSRFARFACIAAIALLAGCGGTRDAASTEMPPVIIISIDTLRASDVSAYGYRRDTTPNLDRFASEAIVCHDAVCNSNNTLISHASMLTSLYPSVHGAVVGTPMRESATTLAEMLAEHGYRNGFFAAHGDWLTERYGFGRAIDDFRTGYVKAPQINAWVDEWLDSELTAPFFLFAHYYDAHSDFMGEGELPYNAPEGFRGRYTADYDGDFTGCDEAKDQCASLYLKVLSDERIQLSETDRAYIRGLYDEEVRYTDAKVGELLDRLREDGWYDRAIIVITSDHGEEFQEHGRFLHESVQEVVARIPLFIRMPGGSPRGSIESMVESVDIVPTILDALGLEIPDRLQGESLLPILEGSEPVTEFAIIQSVAMRTSKWKIMQSGDGNRVLYDIENDPGETRDVIAEHPDVVARFEQALADWMADYPEMAAHYQGRVDPGERESIEIDAAERARLEALGYTVPGSDSGDSGNEGTDRP